jgi:cysteinylglycine-S-conjugate dipeptidase
VTRNPELLRADAILVCDTGNAAVGAPAATVSLHGLVNVVVDVSALGDEVHFGMFGGAAPDALAALLQMLSSLRDRAGNTGGDARAAYGVNAPQHIRHGAQ